MIIARSFYCRPTPAIRFRQQLLKWSDLRYFFDIKEDCDRKEAIQVVAKLRQVDVLVSQGQNMADAIRQIGVSEVTYYRWRQECGGLKTEQVWQRYLEPMVLIELAWLTALTIPANQSAISKRRWIGPATLALLHFALDHLTLFRPLMSGNTPT